MGFASSLAQAQTTLSPILQASAGFLPRWPHPAQDRPRREPGPRGASSPALEFSRARAGRLPWPARWPTASLQPPATCFLAKGPHKSSSEFSPQQCTSPGAAEQGRRESAPPGALEWWCPPTRGRTAVPEVRLQGRTCSWPNMGGRQATSPSAQAAPAGSTAPTPEQHVVQPRPGTGTQTPSSYSQLCKPGSLNTGLGGAGWDWVGRKLGPGAVGPPTASR